MDHNAVRGSRVDAGAGTVVAAPVGAAVWAEWPVAPAEALGACDAGTGAAIDGIVAVALAEELGVGVEYCPFRLRPFAFGIVCFSCSGRVKQTVDTRSKGRPTRLCS